MGDIEPKPAQYFINLMEQIEKEKQKNQTNERWFCNLTTDKKAEVIFDIIEFCLSYEAYPDKKKYKDLMGTVEDIKMWLKKPHKEEEWKNDKL